MENETPQKAAKSQEVAIEVHDEDDGKKLHLRGTSDDLVQHFIDALYQELRTDRKPDDRLRCETSNQDVFQYAVLNIEKYFHEHCEAHVWLFASGTGGADADHSRQG
jgi:hypothetical protein